MHPFNIALAAGLSLGIAALPASADDFAIEGEGFRTAADVRAHNRLPQDLADIRAALAGEAPDFTAALDRYAFGGNFDWRDGFHSFGIFADDYQGRMERTLPGAVGLTGDAAFAHRTLVSAMMGTGEFRGRGQTRSEDPAVRRAVVEEGLLATILNWCRLELTEASIRGPVNGNWSLQNGSPKNWSELFAFWWGPNGAHSLHAEMTVLAERYALPAHPTRLVTAELAAGQPALLEERWPEGEAAAITRALDLAALLLLVDRANDLQAALEDGDEAAQAVAFGAVRGTWLAGLDGIARADAPLAKTLHAQIVSRDDPGLPAAIMGAVASSLGALDLTLEDFGRALRDL
jgi:hypothetical protein